VPEKSDSLWDKCARYIGFFMGYLCQINQIYYGISAPDKSDHQGIYVPHKVNIVFKNNAVI